MSRALIQTRALLVDAYRELNARKLFWVSLVLSGVLVIVFALLDLQGRSVTFAGLRLDLPVDFDRTLFFKMIFTQFGIGVWLTWAATILALISTSGIVPDLISSGTVELLVSKPIGRARLLLSKFVTGLLFVAMQVSVFSVGCFLAFGLKGVFWEPRLLLAVPIVVLFYSYLFCVCVLLGLLMKSTVSALLVTLLFWLALFVLATAETSLLTARQISSNEVEKLRDEVAAKEASTIAAMESQGGDVPAADDTEAIDRANPVLASRRRRLASAEEDLASWSTWADRVLVARAVLPKTGETIGLLERSLIEMDELNAFNDDLGGGPGGPPPGTMDAAADVERTLRDRGVWWIVGTSLVFEGVVLAVCCWRFAKRDF